MDPELLRLLYRIVRPDEHGAVGVNRLGHQSVGPQAAALYIVFAGLREEDPRRMEEMLAEALRAYRYGFQKLEEEGEEGESWPADFLASVSSARSLLRAYDFSVEKSSDTSDTSFPDSRPSLLEKLRPEWDRLEPDLSAALRDLAGRRLGISRKAASQPERLLSVWRALWPEGDPFLEQARGLQQAAGGFGADRQSSLSVQANCVFQLCLGALRSADARPARRLRDTLERAAAWLKMQTAEALAPPVPAPSPGSPPPAAPAGPALELEWEDSARWILALSFWSVLGPDPESADLARRVLEFVRARRVPGLSPDTDEIRRQLLLRQIQFQRVWEDAQVSTPTAARVQPFLTESTSAVQAGDYDRALSALERAIRSLHHAPSP